MQASGFGDGFVWGVSMAAIQVEGALQEDGRSPSVWDVFASKKGKIKGGHHPETACDFYHRYPEDIALAASLRIPNFRFSLSWSRILPDGTGRINQKGLDFYKRLIDQLKSHGIEPWITLYHWDLPQILEDKGGWTNREILDWFGEFAETAGRELSPLGVKNWMILNEPLAFTGAGYFLGYHAPGKKGSQNFLPAMLHAALCTGIGEKAIRSHRSDARIGSCYSCSLITPASGSEADIRAARRVDALLNRLFIEAAMGKGFPLEDLPFLRKVEKWMKPEDEQNLLSHPDFIGVQNYTREVVGSCCYVPYLKAKIKKASKRGVPHTAMNWEIYPDSLLQMLRKFSQYRPDLPLIVTENGAAFPDDWHGQDLIQDDARIRYLSDHIQSVKTAREMGIRAEGYFVWTLLDNFEWAEGYHPRFGLIYMDFESQRRIMKSSGLWYRDFLSAL
jgi:beta-glucosidase